MLKTEFARAHRILSTAAAITGVSVTNLKWGLRLAKRKARPKDKWFPLGFPVKSNGHREAVEEELSSDLMKLGLKKDCLVIAFVGSFSQAFNFKTVVDVAHIFSREGNDCIQFVLVGDGVQNLYLQTRSKGLKNIILTGWCEKKQVEAILGASSIGLAPYTSDGLITLSNKPFEYMAASLPLLSSLNGELKKMIEKESIGLQYNADDPIDLKEKILWFLSHPEETQAMGQRAKRLFEKQYRADIVYKGMVQHLEKIAKDRGRGMNAA